MVSNPEFEKKVNRGAGGKFAPKNNTHAPLSLTDLIAESVADQSKPVTNPGIDVPEEPGFAPRGSYVKVTTSDGEAKTYRRTQVRGRAWWVEDGRESWLEDELPEGKREWTQPPCPKGFEHTCHAYQSEYDVIVQNDKGRYLRFQNNDDEPLETILNEHGFDVDGEDKYDLIVHHRNRPQNKEKEEQA